MSATVTRDADAYGNKMGKVGQEREDAFCFDSRSRSRCTFLVRISEGGERREGSKGQGSVAERVRGRGSASVGRPDGRISEQSYAYAHLFTLSCSRSPSHAYAHPLT